MPSCGPAGYVPHTLAHSASRAPRHPQSSITFPSQRRAPRLPGASLVHPSALSGHPCPQGPPPTSATAAALGPPPPLGRMRAYCAMPREGAQRVAAPLRRRHAQSRGRRRDGGRCARAPVRCRAIDSASGVQAGRTGGAGGVGGKAWGAAACVRCASMRWVRATSDNVRFKPSGVPAGRLPRGTRHGGARRGVGPWRSRLRRSCAAIEDLLPPRDADSNAPPRHDEKL